MFLEVFFLSLICNLACVYTADEKACDQYLDSASCCNNAACTWANCSVAFTQSKYSCVNATWLANGTLPSKNITCFVSNSSCNTKRDGSTHPATTTKGLSKDTTAPTTTTVTKTSNNSATTVGNHTSPHPVTKVTKILTSTRSSNGTTQKLPSTGHRCTTGIRFHGGSFFGGMVLCAGMLLIAAVAYKYYQSRVIIRYHQF